MKWMILKLWPDLHGTIPQQRQRWLIGMNDAMMTDYIRYVTDRLLLQLGYSKENNVANPFAFMELISLDSKANFFERTVSAYALADTSGRESAFENLGFL